MVDTTVLSIPEGQFEILNHKRFSPSTEGLYERPFLRMGSKAYIKCVQNPTRQELKISYKPNLTVIKAKRQDCFVKELKIQCSVPKICFGNNFDELEDADLDRSIRILVGKLYEMGVVVSFDVIKNASISAIHYSKNFILTDYTTCSMVINELKFLDLPSRIDIGEEKFKNGGYALHFHTDTRDIVFYDKMKDLERAKLSPKKAIEQANEMQLHLFEEYAEKKPQVLRMEVRLGKRAEIKRVLDKVGVDVEFNFQSLFSKDISKKVLGYWWDQIKSASYMLDFKSEGVFEAAETIRINYPNMKPKRLLELVGAMVLAKEGSARRLRGFLGYDGSPSANRKWYALKKDIKSLKYHGKAGYKALSGISQSIERYSRVSLDQL